MKPTDFINENCQIADEAENMHLDHEVQMARSQLYNCAQYAIELHRMLKDISEMEGLEGWVQAKITKATDYLGAVKHHLEYQQVEQSQDEMMDFVPESADFAMQKLLDETATAGGTSSGAVASNVATGAGNGFASGGPGTIKRYGNTNNSDKVKFGKGVYKK